MDDPDKGIYTHTHTHYSPWNTFTALGDFQLTKRDFFNQMAAPVMVWVSHFKVGEYLLHI